MLLLSVVHEPFKIIYVYPYRLFSFSGGMKTIDNRFDIEIGCESLLKVRIVSRIHFHPHELFFFCSVDK